MCVKSFKDINHQTEPTQPIKDTLWQRINNDRHHPQEVVYISFIANQVL